MRRVPLSGTFEKAWGAAFSFLLPEKRGLSWESEDAAGALHEEGGGGFLEAWRVAGTDWELEASLGPKQPFPNPCATGQGEACPSSPLLAAEETPPRRIWAPEEVKIGRESP